MNAVTHRRCRRSAWLVALVCATTFFASAGAKVPVEVDGLGWIDGREMRVTLGRLLNMDAIDSLNANAIEDAAVILASALEEEGYQSPDIEVIATLADGTVKRFHFDPTFANPVPRPLAARAVEFRVTPGTRWRVARVWIDGLTIFPARDAEAYFRSEATLFVIASTNAYSKSRLSRSVDALLGELKRRGYVEADVRADVAYVDEKTGAVTVRVAVHEGSRWVVGDVRINGEAEGVTPPDPAQWRGENWTPALGQDIREAVRRAFYAGGYPDVGVHVVADAAEARDGRRPTAVVVTVVPGPRVTMGRARFEGDEVTRESVLRRRVSLPPGAPLNPIEIERARYRLSRLGVFESIDLHYEPPPGETRDPVFVVKEGSRYETNLLFGYGSYEQLRGGVEYRQMNIFGMAHQSRLQLIQSMKSTRGEYTYSVPELFGETIDGAGKLFGLQRQEIAFLRQEYGATLSLRRAIRRIHGKATLGYTFQALRNRKNGLSTEATDEKQINVASLDLGLRVDRRDSALRPRRGYHATLQVELASPALGGVAEYQRFELNGAYHTPWGRGRWIHVGFSHGVITTFGAANDLDLPVNKRFFPGGDNSIRGYATGEAAPRGADNRFVGAKTYTLLNLEFEQALTPNWSIVAFGDALGTAARLKDYPYRDRLYSLGVGLRYQTIVGPIRLEYGRNINPRPADPPGTWQISLGYPF